MWSQIGMTLAGMWLMASAGILGFSKDIADNAHIVGPVIATFSIIALSESTRNVRYFNIPLALWLFVAPWVLQYGNAAAIINDYAVAITILLLSRVKVRRKYRFAGGWPAAWK